MFTNKKISDSDYKSAKNTNKKYFDLTAIMSENTVVYPGDPSFQSEHLCSIGKGQTYNLCHLQLGNHTGTHVDFPAHVMEGGKTSSDFSIEDLIGAGLIIKVPDEEKTITKKFVSELPILKSDIVFFKTANSRLSKQDKFTDKYVYIEPDASYELLKKGVRIVGIDYISVDKYNCEELPVHKSLLSNEVLIVEGLELNNSPLGRCEIFILPLNIPDIDGAPARVIARL